MKIQPIKFLPVIILLGIGIAFAFGLRNDPSKLASTMINKPWPDFTLERVIADQPAFSREDLHGKISLVNVFGSWCAACVQEHPMLMRLANREGVIIYGIDWRDTAEAGSAWLEKYGNPYRKVGLDANSRLAIDLGVTGAPETFLVDKNAQIRFKVVGPIDEKIWTEQLKPMIQLLQNET